MYQYARKACTIRKKIVRQTHIEGIRILFDFECGEERLQ